MVINQYKAKGPLTSMLMSVVAIDDAVALIGCGFAATIVKMMNSQEDVNILLSIVNPILEIVISFLIGGILSIFMKIIFRWFKKPSNVLCITIAFIMLAYWLAEQ